MDGSGTSSTHSPIRLVLGRGACNSETGVGFLDWAPRL